VAGIHPAQPDTRAAKLELRRLSGRELLLTPLLLLAGSPDASSGSRVSKSLEISDNSIALETLVSRPAGSFLGDSSHPKTSVMLVASFLSRFRRQSDAKVECGETQNFELHILLRPKTNTEIQYSSANNFRSFQCSNG